MPEFITAIAAYKMFGIPRSLLRNLANRGVIERHEKLLDGDRVMNLYCRRDIEEYLNRE